MKRNKFSLSHYKLLSCRMGELIPCGLVEVLPGDTLQQATSALVRCSPLNAPVMHPVHCRIHHWYVPHRLVWEDFEDFITGGPDGNNVSELPTITFGGGSGAAVGSLADYLGVVPGVNNLEVSALPFRGYALIWNEWYRDQDLQTALAISLASGADSTTSTALQRVAWEKDYFTSARPWEQKGPSVTVPLGTYAPVEFNPAEEGTQRWREIGTGNQGDNIGGTNWGVATGQSRDASNSKLYDLNPGDSLRTDLSSASAVTVNVLREALALQRYEEARARYGSRYSEYLRYLGVRSSDARLQRPEYLGGGKQTIQFSEVLQTAEGTDPVGELRGHGIGALRSNRYRRFFEEHGYVFSFISIRPRTMYTQGLARTFNRVTKEDFWQREFEHIGQQEVLNKEVYAAHSSPDGVFGYQDRYDEYRRQESSVAGEFRETTLDYWHMARVFSGDPALNGTFVECQPTERIFAASTNDTMYVMANHSIQARRQLSKKGNSYTF